MKKILLVTSSLTGLWMLPAAAQPVAPDCPALLDFDAPDVAISEADVVAAADGMPEYCDVRGTIRENVNFALHLPTDWNGRFNMVGNGGKAGVISFDAMKDALPAGFATASTDTGHDNEIPEQAGSRFGSDREMRTDFAYRAVHETAVASKAVIEAHYGRPADYSYWVGCSTGGRQGLMEAQRFPGDFDGIVAGAPVADYTSQQMNAPGFLRALYDEDPYTEEPVLSAQKARLLGDVVYDKCDAIDGLEDGLITNPAQCTIDLEADLPLCDGEAGENCFTPAEVAAIDRLYSGLSDADGAQILPGIPPGSERMPGGWVSWLIADDGAPRPPQPLLHTVMFDAFNWLMFEEDRPDYAYMTDFDFDTDIPLLDAAAELYNATDPDLDAFREGGGKLILYHGWGDPGVSAYKTIEYHERVEAHLDETGAGEEIDSFMRMYLLPGVGHCRGGIGHDRADWLSEIVAWVEDGEAPEAIVAGRASDDSTRPHCPYPQQAVHDGSGDQDSAASFTCEVP